MKAKEVHYDSAKNIITASGDIFVQMDKYTLRADKMHYHLKDDVIFAEGNIRITDDNGRVVYGERAVFKDKLKRGIIEAFITKFDKNTILVSRLAHRINNHHVELNQAVFTPCEMNCGNKPLWQLKSSHTDINYDRHTISYKHMFFEVYGVPIIYLPYFSHPTPSSPAQSGLLIPKIRNSSLIVPFYFRPKSNLDFTISPRLAKNYTILEAEMRHKIESGQYEIHGSYGNPTLQKDQTSEKSKPKRYYFLSDGEFSKNGINYGFTINRASDKAYLVNYHELYDSYLTSNIYANIIDRRNYFLLEGFYFQDLRFKETKLVPNSQSKTNTSFVLPSIRTQNTYMLNDNESLLFNIRSNTITYNDSNKQVARTSLGLELMQNLVLDTGHLVTLSLANRSDLYWNRAESPDTLQEQEKTLYRNIPEFSTKWRYPLIKAISSKSNFIIEPTAMFVIGKKYKPGLGKYELVDPTKDELSENNIFSTNSFSGIDNHDYGNRFSYGINSSLLSEYFYVDAFLGQLAHNNNVTGKSNADYVGNVRIDSNNNFALFYRFRRDSLLRPIRNEVGANSSSDKFIANLIFTELHNISHYFNKNVSKDNETLKKNKASQVSFDINYNLVTNLWVGAESKIDLINKKELTRSIRVTFLYDCASISGAITDNFLSDSTRGVKKQRSQTFSVGLKVINM